MGMPLPATEVPLCGESEFGPTTAMKLSLLENYEKKLLTVFIRARNEKEHLRWFDKLRGKRTTDQGTEYSALGMHFALCHQTKSFVHQLHNFEQIIFFC